MRWPWTKPFRPEEDDEAIERYIETAARARLDVAEGTPALLERLPGTPECARRRVDFGRGRDLVLSFYPADPKRELAEERLAIARSLAKREIPVPELVFDDRDPNTRRTFGFEVVAERHIDPAWTEGLWPERDAFALAGMLRRIHALTGKSAGKPWRPVNPEKDFPASLERRWKTALEAAQSALARQVNPAAQGSFLEKSLAWLEGVSRYELVHGNPCPWAFGRRGKGRLTVVAFTHFHFGCREWDLVLAEQAFQDGADVAQAFVEKYLRGMPEAVTRRCKTLKPFFLALYRLEQAAQAAPVLLPQSPKDEKAAPAEDDNSAACWDKALKSWQAFLEATGLQEA